ncbi:MAG: hypothetical protein ABSC11_05910 [Smithella sp.]|jgi:hypothetical protein
MKINEVPQDETSFYEGNKRACYALNDEGKYVIVPSSGWNAEDVVNGLAVDELKNRLEETRQKVIKGLISPLAYYMELRQMTPEILAKTAGIFSFRVKRHFHPKIFAKLKSPVIKRYVLALAITEQELKSVPGKPRE